MKIFLHELIIKFTKYLKKKYLEKQFVKNIMFSPREKEADDTKFLMLNFTYFNKISKKSINNFLLYDTEFLKFSKTFLENIEFICQNTTPID